jgi:hypothetical protein
MNILQLLIVNLLFIGVFAKTKLYVNYYLSSNTERQSEIDLCLNNNINNPYIDTIYVIVDNIPKYLHLNNSNKITLIYNPNRPTFDDMFNTIDMYSADLDVSITCNADIYFDNTIKLAIDYFEMHNEVAMALSRWDVGPNIVQNVNPGSQDAWIIYGKPKKYIDANFYYGKWACDNRIAYELHKVGYIVINPSSNIKIYHMHLSNVRSSTYGEEERVPGPYKDVTLIYLD